MSAPLDVLLAESPDAAALRADQTFADANAGRPVVLYGAGGVGRNVLAALRGAGVEPVCFADRSADGTTSVDGLPVLGLADAAARHGADATFVVTILNPRFPFASVRDALHEAGCAHVVSWIPLAWRHADALLPYYAIDRPERILAAADDIRRAYALLDDDRSRDEFLRQLEWRLTGEFTLPEPLPVSEQYFSADVVTLVDDEVFVDCGAYDGDTLASFLEHNGGRFSRFIALEPEPDNLAALQARVAALPADVAERVEILPYASAAQAGTVTFGGSGTGAGISEDGHLTVETVALDDVVAGPVTYLKMDIEGAEPDALAGAAGIVTRDRPVLGLCAYHVPDHLWSLLLAVDALADGYTYRMRRYGWDCWEVVLYALPTGRVAS